MTFPFLLLFPSCASLEWVCEKQRGLSGGPQAGFAILSIKDFAEFLISQQRMATTRVTIMKCWLYESHTCKDYPLCYLNEVPQYTAGRNTIGNFAAEGQRGGQLPSLKLRMCRDQRKTALPEIGG